MDVERACNATFMNVFQSTKIQATQNRVVYVDKEHLRVHKIEYFDRKNDHKKTLKQTSYKKFGHFWRASKWTMVNHLRGKSTIIEWNDRQFGAGDFNKNAMKRHR